MKFTTAAWHVVSRVPRKGMAMGLNLVEMILSRMAPCCCNAGHVRVVKKQKVSCDKILTESKDASLKASKRESQR